MRVKNVGGGTSGKQREKVRVGPAYPRRFSKSRRCSARASAPACGIALYMEARHDDDAAGFRGGHKIACHLEEGELKEIRPVFWMKGEKSAQPETPEEKAAA